MAHAGYDSVTVDLQHGLIHYDAAVPMVQAISTTAAVPLARVPWNEPGIIMKMLDAGCFGIVCPMVNTREECERFVGACRYADAGGYRSWGPVRALVTAGPTYFAHASDIVLTFAMIETAQAIRNLDDIVSTPGLNAVYVGPSDLSLSIDGKPQGDYKDRPDLLDVLRRVVDACDKRGDASRNERPDVCSATRLELHFGGDGDATRQRATLRGGKTDAGTLECLGREMHLVLVLAFAMACLFGVPTFFSVTVIAAAFVAGRGQQGE